MLGKLFQNPFDPDVVISNSNEIIELQANEHIKDRKELDRFLYIFEHWAVSRLEEICL